MEQLQFLVSTLAGTGNIEIKHFSGKSLYDIAIHPPEDVLNNTNYTLTLKIELSSMKNVTNSTQVFIEGIGYLNNSQKLIVQNFTPPEFVYMNISRGINREDFLNNWLHAKVPRIKLSWSYSKDIGIQEKFKNGVAFRRYFYIKIK